jgi:hypothetical protein
MNKYIIFCLALLFSGLLFVPHMHAQHSPPSKYHSVPLADLLLELGNTYECYFTIEEGFVEDEPENGLELQILPRDQQYSELKTEMAALNQKLPNITYEVDDKNPRIVHIIDVRLRQQSNYPLNRTISTINYNGHLEGLIAVIRKKGIPISGPRLMTFADMRSVDLKTIVQIQGQELTVRNALTNFIKLEGRSRILWTARTPLGEEMSYIQFNK